MFGDLVVDLVMDHVITGGATWTATIRNAPPMTRIPLADVAEQWHLSVDTEGICVGGVVWYRPVELSGDGLTLICQKIRDMRPLMEQSAENVARRAPAHH
jgi:hypothetical protein